MLPNVLIAALAGLWLWWITSQLSPPIIGPMVDWLRRKLPTKLADGLDCPWCWGAWCALPPTIILAWHTDLPWLSVGVLWLAAAGFVGVGGALLAMFVDTPTEG